MPAKPHRFGFARPASQMSDETFQNLNVWLVAWGMLDDMTIVELSDQVLTSSEHSIGIFRDEGGPLEYEPDEFKLLLSAVIQAVIPDQAPISCRVVEPHWFFGMKTHFYQIGVDKPRLTEVFTRFGLDPDNVVDYIFVGESLFADAKLLKDSAGFMDRLLHQYWMADKMVELPPEVIERLKELELVVYAQEGFLTIISTFHSRDEIRSILEKVAEDFGLDLPESDYVLTSLP